MARPGLIAALLGAALALVGAGAPAASAALTAASMYEPSTVVAIELTLPPDSLAALEADPTGEYVEGTFALAESDGTPAGVGATSDPIVVGIRLKGGPGSFRPLSGKAAFKVKFNEFVGGQKFLGLKKLTLNNMVQDPSMTHEVLAYGAFRAAGIAAPRTGFARVRLNGVDYGLHLNVESMDDVALKDRFGSFDDPQHLYEGSYGVDVRPGSAPDFEVDEGDEDNRSDLEALIAAAATPATAPLEQRLQGVADLEQMTAMWALERYLGHWDGYSGRLLPNNYYLYSDPDGVFQMLPWGADQTWAPTPFTGPGGLLFELCLADPGCTTAYRADLVEAAATVASLEPELRARELESLLAPWQAAEDPPGGRPYTEAEFHQGVDEVVTFAAGRAAELAQWLASPEPDPATEPGGSRVPKGSDEPGAEADAAPANPAPRSGRPLSRRLDADRSRLGRGLLITRATVRGPGSILQVARILTAAGPVRACASERAVAGGSATLHCRLSPRVRRHLDARWLRLRVRTSFTPAGDSAGASFASTVLLPRQAS